MRCRRLGCDVDRVTAYRSDSYAWFRVAELGFDSFQMRMRARS